MKFDHKKGRYITSGDTNLYIEEIDNGNAPILIVLHGGFGSIEDYNSIIPVLSSAFKVIGIDTRGHGASALGSQPLTYKLLADDLACVIQALGLNKYNLMGFSDGGTVAYRHAMRQPEGLEKLITIGAGWELNVGDPEWEMYSEMNGKIWKRMFPESYQHYMSLNPERDWDTFASNVINMWKDLTPGNYPRELVQNITCETLVIRGDQDQLTSLESMARLAKIMKNMHYCNIPFAEHVAFDDQPELVLNVLRQFLKMDIEET